MRIPGKFRKLQIIMIEVTEKYVITKFRKTFLINAQHWMNDLLPTSLASIRVTLVKVAYLYFGQP